MFLFSEYLKKTIFARNCTAIFFRNYFTLCTEANTLLCPLYFCLHVFAITLRKVFYYLAYMLHHFILKRTQLSFTPLQQSNGKEQQVTLDLEVEGIQERPDTF